MVKTGDLGSILLSEYIGGTIWRERITWKK